MMKKTGGQKFRWTVPLKSRFFFSTNNSQMRLFKQSDSRDIFLKPREDITEIQYILVYTFYTYIQYCMSNDQLEKQYVSKINKTKLSIYQRKTVHP